MPVAAFLTRFYAFAGVKDGAHHPDPVSESVSDTGWATFVGVATSLEGARLWNHLCWATALILLFFFGENFDLSC